MDEPISPDAARVNGTAAVGTAEGPLSGDGSQRGETTASASPVGLTPTFLAGLAAAMRETAIRERDRISGVVAEDAAAHVEKVRARAAIETEELRRLAEEDVEHIEQWSASEIARIQSEAAQRTEDRRSSLDEYLKQHDAIIETEIQGVDGAVKDYESTLDRFFAELSEQTEPAAIVRRAGQLPTPPDLDEIRATARASAMAQLAESESSASAVTATAAEPAEPAEAIAEVVAEAAPAEAEPVETVESVAAVEPHEAAESSDDGTLAGVMDDGGGSVEPTETTEPIEREVAVAEEVTSGEAEPASEERPAVAEPVGVMEPDAQRVPSWPAPAPRAEAAQIAPTIDNTSAAVRLLRSVAPWTAPTHAGDRAQSDSE
jgi:ribonuclease E